MKITIANQKGGVGKSSISFMLLCALLHYKKRANFIDCDPQKSTTDWISEHDLDLDESANFIIVDTPPNLSNKEAREHFETSDKIIVVATPNFIDVQVTKNSLEIFKNFQAETKIVWNKVKPKTRLETKSIGNYEKILGVESYKQHISERACFSRLPLNGWNGLDEKAKLEILSLIFEIIN